MDRKGNTIIAVDFDGTLCSPAWPKIGRPNKSLLHRLKRQQEKGTRLILWTCREGELLKEAVDWCKNYGLIFDTINEQLPELTELYGNDTRKICADIYIDDKGVNPMPGRAITGILTGSPYIKMTKGSRLRKKKAAGVV